MEYHKVKSVSKYVRPKGPELRDLVLNTMKTISDVVGATLGPGGCPVIIERQENNLPAMVTKDGVTVYRALGFRDSIAHVVMEASRDASIRTAAEAGDGTTTATILSEAITRLTYEYCDKNPKVSPQRVVQKLRSVFPKIEALIKSEAMTANLGTPEGRALLWSVAKVSANGDEALADAVLECYDLVGDEGNVTLVEVSGPSQYEVEPIAGYPIPMGYEDSCEKYYSKFINDVGGQRCYLEKPAFVIYNGRINDVQVLIPLMERIAAAWELGKDGGPQFTCNVVVVATGFGDHVLASLAANFPFSNSINVFPLRAPLSPFGHGQQDILEDLLAVTGGAKLFDPLSNRLEVAQLEDLGLQAKSFEANRFKSTVISKTDESGALDPNTELMIMDQVERLRGQLKQAGSELDEDCIEERIGKLTGGIAKLKIVGSSSGEMRERRDRAEDAVCAVRGAIKHGALPGGCWALMKIGEFVRSLNDPMLSEVLVPALEVPLHRLLHNCGYLDDEIEATRAKIVGSFGDKTPMVYDALEAKYVEPVSGGVLDSVPAVLEALRNSLSIASLLGTLGAAIVFERDAELERTESKETTRWLRNEEIADQVDSRQT